jgi:hypothetical protein
MEAKTKPQYWFEAKPRSTEELIQLWEAGDLDARPEIDIDTVEKILVARHILQSADERNANSQARSNATPLVDSFLIKQVTSKRKANRWEVNLTQDQAEFIEVSCGDRFVIERELSRPEFQFKRTGPMMLNEDTTALVRGKVFDFGAHKHLLLAWLPSYTIDDLGKELQDWGIGMILVGILSLMFSTTFGPILGSILIALGIISLIARKRVIFLANGLALIAAGLSTIVTTVGSAGLILGDLSIVSIFWMMLGLFMFVWGWQEFRKFRIFSNLQ